MALLTDRLFFMPLIDLAATADKSQVALVVPGNLATVARLSWAFAIFEIALILLLISFRKFSYPWGSLSRRAKIFLIAVLVVIVLPIFGLMDYAYIKTKDTDMGYSQAQSQAGFHLYRPNYLPSGIFQASKPQIQDGSFNNKRFFVGFAPFIRESFDDKRIMTISQEQAPASLDLEGFVKKQLQDSKYLDKSFFNNGKVSLAKDQKGYFTRQVSTSGKTTIYYLHFLTMDNVHIIIMGLATDQGELTRIAESLK